MKRNSFDRKKRQFRNLANRVNQLIYNGEWDKLSAETRKFLILKLNSFYKQLSSYFSHFELKKILAAAAIFIGFPLVSQSQEFAHPQENPFGLTPVMVDYAWPVFADIDHDDDLDLFSGNYGGSMQFYENTGTITAPFFALPQQDPFGLTPVNMIAFPAFADIDNDGDLDLFIGDITEFGYDGNFQFFENTGTETAPVFAAPQQNPFGLMPAYLFAIPEFADIDNDGDLDLFAGEGDGNMKFYENVGVDTLASFAAPLQNPFGITPAYVIGTPAFSDIDHDGDLDLFVGEYYGNMLYFENTGTVTTPAFVPPVTNPFGLVPTYGISLPAFADLDDDGDEDLLIGEYYGNFQYFQNTEDPNGIPVISPESIFDLYPNPATDMVYLSLKDNSQNKPLEFVIYDQLGGMVMSGPLNTQLLKLETGNLAPGVYFVRLVREDEVFTRRLVIR